MQRSDLQPGKSYALRRSRRLGEQPVKVAFEEYIPRVRKAKVRHQQEPHPGLVEYVPVGVLLCPWPQVPQFLKEEERLQALIDAAEPVPKAVEEAVNVVFAATGEDLWLERSGLGGADRETLARVAARAGLSTQEVNQLTAYPAFLDRRKQLQMPGARMVWLAQRFGRAEPELVHLYIAAEEEKYRAEGYQIGQRYMHELLIEQSPAFALARQWAGQQAALEDLGREIDRLRGLVQNAIYALEKAGVEAEARRLRRALGGG